MAQNLIEIGFWDKREDCILTARYLMCSVGRNALTPIAGEDRSQKTQK